MATQKIIINMALVLAVIAFAFLAVVFLMQFLF